MSGCCAPLVAIVKATDLRKHDDFGLANRLRGGRPHRWRALGETKVRPIVVVVGDEFGKQPLQLAFVEHDHVVEQIAPHGFNPSLGDPVLPRAVWRDLVPRQNSIGVSKRRG